MTETEEAVEEAVQALGMTKQFRCYYYINERREISMPDIEASNIEAAAAKAYEHVIDESPYNNDDILDELPNLSIYVTDPDEDIYTEISVDGRSKGEPWASRALEIVQQLALAETDEERQRLVVEAREALTVSRSPEWV